MRLAPRERPTPAISLVAMIDVLMIMLVFFMVTSTYLHLDMLPMAEGRDRRPSVAETVVAADRDRLLIRLGADGQAHVQGRAVSPETLSDALAERIGAAPGVEVIVLPSGGAPVQALVAVMDGAVSAGAEQVRIVRLEARP